VGDAHAAAWKVPVTCDDGNTISNVPSTELALAAVTTIVPESSDSLLPALHVLSICTHWASMPETDPSWMVPTVGKV
jgi:hypothetical protein